MHYAVLKTQPITAEQTGLLDAHLKSVSPKVSAISVVHYTAPQVVLVHCQGEGLNDAELAAVQAAIDDDLGG